MDKKKMIIPSDDIFTTSTRLTIMILLLNYKKILLNELKNLLQLSSGNLDHHVKKLVKSGYVTTKKGIFPNRPLIIVEITSKGVKAFKAYLQKVKVILDQISVE